MFQFLRLSAKFLAVLRLSISPIETLIQLFVFVVQCCRRRERSHRFVSSLVFRVHDLWKIANINPQQEATLSLWKKLVPRESAGNGA